MKDDVTVRVRDGSFSWSSEAYAPIISGINLEIPTGKLTMVVGKVGAGKTSLISALLGEMHTLYGDVMWNSGKSSIAYAAQKAWLVNASLMDNILFREPYDRQRYQSVIDAACLQPDIDILPAGDQTEIGEKGINLSGGQKQRVSVARAMYSNKDVVILDDPLSALDVHVGGHLFFEGILNFLIEENRRTVILVSHQINFLGHADLVVYMEDGLIVRQGTMREIRKLDPDLLTVWNIEIKSMSKADNCSTGGCSTDQERDLLKKRVSKKSKCNANDASCSSKLVKSEERMRGSVSYHYYLYYCKQFGIVFALLVFALAILQNAVRAGTDVWLSAWSAAGDSIDGNASREEAVAIRNKYLGGYCALNSIDIVMAAVWNGLVLILSVRTARKLHENMFTSILRAPMRFFDITPTGRIMNRLAADIEKIDQRLGSLIYCLLRVALILLSGLIINAVISWYFVIAAIPAVAAYFFLMKVYMNTAREIQRLESISRSPIFAYFSETLGGLTTIRAYGLHKEFRRNIISQIEQNNIAFCYLRSCQRWIGVRLDFVGAVIGLAAGITSLSAAVLSPGTFGASLVGLAISYANKINIDLTWIVRYFAETEMNMNAVERLKYYAEVESERDRGSTTPRTTWPEHGYVTYDRVHARYARDLQAVLHGVSVAVRPGTKIGICGRTGSGKSSLTLTLFRIIDTFKGTIRIDDVDISTLPLVDLRSRIAIVPQDPVLFTGTVRFNLDPHEKCSDVELWEAIHIAQLKSVVLDLPAGLDSMVYEGGDNFSVGQRQLFCLARAFLKKSRILVLDEATASIDFQTDAVLQGVVSSAFEGKTVITIAHRVSTIMDSDYILALSDGHVAEVGTPSALLEKEHGLFASLVEENK